jgi:hypothetical protein
LEKQFLIFLSGTEAKKHNNIHKLVIEKGRLYSGEEKASMNNGFRAYMSNKIPLINSAGKIIGLLGISIDITERKRLEDVEKQIYKQMAFYELGKVTNDIGTPLRALKVVEDMYKDTFRKREKKMFEFSVESIKDIGDRLISKYRSMKESVYNSFDFLENLEIERVKPKRIR